MITQLTLRPAIHFKWNRMCTLALVLAILIALVPQVSASNLIPHAQPVLLELAKQQPDRPISVIVQKNSAESTVEQALSGMGGKITRDFSIIKGFAAELPASRITELSTLPGVKWVSLDSPVVKSVCADCAATTAPWDIEINANDVWNNSSGTASQYQGQGITVAVLDSGIAKGLGDFSNYNGAGNRVINQIKLNSSTNNMNDGYGHGTLVAGIIGSNGSLSNNAYVGVAPQVNLINVKVTDDNGAASSSDVVSGMQWIYNYNQGLSQTDPTRIRVVNISMNNSVASTYDTDPLCAAAEILWFNGVVVVTSAGNNGTSTLYAPANDPFVITVGAADDKGTTSLSDDAVASFSAYGTITTSVNGLPTVITKPDLVAPGRYIFSDVQSNAGIINGHTSYLKDSSCLTSSTPCFLKVSGTSFAAPMVSGAAALLLQSNPNLNPDQVKYRLKATALQSAARGTWDKRTLWKGYNASTAGAGYLDIQAAINQTGITGSANLGYSASLLLTTGLSPVNLIWGSVNWTSVNWTSVNWTSVNWTSVNWTSVNWTSDYWG
ncbi:MAG TPA: S8 family peptidase [Chloroflexia bacterium]|nr:S8 family peptidase [Chloroflexia bacterium]